MAGESLKVSLRSLHGFFSTHTGFARSIQDVDKSDLSRDEESYVRNWVPECEIFIHDKCFQNTQITPKLIIISLQMIHYQNWHLMEALRLKLLQLIASADMRLHLYNLILQLAT